MIQTVPKKRIPINWVILIILAVIWGSSFILIKNSLTVYSPNQVAAVRVFSAFLFLLVFAIPNLKKVARKKWKYLIISGLTGNFLPAFLFAKAQTNLDSSMAGILNALTPLFILIIGGLFFRMAVKRLQVVGIIIGLTGSIWLSLIGTDGGFGKINYFALYILAATICYGVNVNLLKSCLSDLKPVLITSMALFTVGPLAGAYLFTTDFVNVLTTSEDGYWALYNILALGIVGTAIALILFNRLIQISTPVFAGSVTYLIPIVALLIGLAAGELIGIMHIIGMAVILGGVYIVNKSK